MVFWFLDLGFKHLTEIIFRPQSIFHGIRNCRVTKNDHYTAILFGRAGGCICYEKYSWPGKRKNFIRVRYIKYNTMFAFYLFKPFIRIAGVI